MKSVIPYKKEIEFKTKIAEICSISLEHHYEIEDSELKGEFVVSGDYKVHEVSVNKELFSYSLPFSIDLSEDIVVDSVNFEILDFTYEVVDEDKLEVYIEFSVEAEEKVQEENIFETIEERSTDDDLEDLIKIEEELEERNTNEEVVVPEKEEEPLEKVEILEGNKENTYITYHIHMVKESESLESIASLYNTSRATIEEYNDISNLVVGDKIIIPVEDNE